MTALNVCKEYLYILYDKTTVPEFVFLKSSFEFIVPTPKSFFTVKDKFSHSIFASTLYSFVESSSQPRRSHQLIILWIELVKFFHLLQMQWTKLLFFSYINLFIELLYLYTLKLSNPKLVYKKIYLTHCRNIQIYIILI